jgi:hypothetical protein
MGWEEDVVHPRDEVKWDYFVALFCTCDMRVRRDKYKREKREEK